MNSCKCKKKLSEILIFSHKNFYLYFGFNSEINFNFILKYIVLCTYLEVVSYNKKNNERVFVCSYSFLSYKFDFN